MKVTIEKDELVVRIPIAPGPSSTGKTILIATTHGYIQTELLYDNKPVVVSLNAYIKK